MCNHKYQKSVTTQEEDHCPIQSYYSKWGKTIITHLEKMSYPGLDELSGLNDQLPIDGKGLCLYHSQDVDWKIAMNFPLRFQQLWGIIQAINDGIISFESRTAYQNIDLRECMFIGEQRSVHPKRFIEFPKLNLNNYIYIILHRAVFEDSLTIADTVLTNLDVDFKWCVFKGLVQLNKAIVTRISFEEAQFYGGKQITKTTVDGVFEAAGMVVNGMMSILNSEFRSDVFFSETQFQLDNFSIDHSIFEGRVDFSECLFSGDIDITCSRFSQEVRFINTNFLEPISFFDNTIESLMIFHSTDSAKKLFSNLVYFNIEEENLRGTISFEQVNFMNIVEDDRSRLVNLARENKVVIGKGCVKYRLQSSDKTIYLDKDKRNLVIEFAHSFASFFNRSNGINLGVEIKHQDDAKVVFFYFSDENISQEGFEERLAENEDNFLSLLLIKPGQIITKSNTFHLLDAYASLIGLFIKISTRIRGGTWGRKDTDSILSAIRYTKSPLLDTNVLHQLIVEKFRLPQVIQYFNIENKNTMKINKPKFIGGQHQFADKIENNYNVTFKRTDFWKNISQDIFSKSDLLLLQEYLEILEKPHLPDLDKYDAIHHISNILGQQADLVIPDNTHEAFFQDRKGEVIRFDAFLSFANEDVEVAEGIYKTLTKAGLNVWFSRVHLKNSNSILGVISEAIKNSDSGIMLLSKSTFSDRKHFPIQELYTFQNLYMYKELLVFPIYHEISHDYILDHSPMLADLYASNTNKNLEMIAKEFSESLLDHRKTHNKKD